MRKYYIFDPCRICTNQNRDIKILCVVENIADLWAIERSQNFNGFYHVLGGTLSALDGVGPEQLRINQLIKRIDQEPVEELILATNATIEGQITAHYIAESLISKSIKITKLAQGLPIGGELDYLDDGTLATALKARLKISS